MKMKMASLSSITVLLLCCFVSTGSSNGCEKYAPTGGNFTVLLGYKTFTKLNWKFKDSIIFSKRNEIILSGKPEDVNKNGDLILINLKKSQSGDYIPEVYDEHGIAQPVKSTHLCVIDPVKKPKIEPKCEESKVTYTCLPDPKDKDSSLRWFRDGVVIKDANKASLTITAKETTNVKFSCEVYNAASSKRSDTKTHDCISHSVPGLPDELFGVSIWVFVGGGAGVVLVLIIIVVACCLRTKRRKSMRLKDEEELRLDWTNNQQQNHHHHLPPLPGHHPNHHHNYQNNQQQAGNTGPRQSRSKQQRNLRPKAPEPSEDQPQPKPRRSTQAPRPVGDNDEQPPPLPQPRKKIPKTQME